MHISQSITDLVGNTPLLRLAKLSEETGNEIIAKLEYFNPLSSVKDRIALGMIEAAEREGKISAGSLIVEPTSGNTGIGLAFISASRGYRLILTMPESLSIERRNLLKALGAQVVLTASEGGMKAAIEKAEEIVRENPGSFMPQQFLNPANPEAHRRTTAKEILHDTDGQIDYFVSGIGTGGTITGTGEVLKKEVPGVKIIAVEPEESAVLSGNTPGSHKIQGIGAGFIPGVLNTELIDEILQVSSIDAAGMTRQLARTEGLFVGISSGAAVTAAYRIAKREPFSGKRIVVILPDTGERYLSTWIFKDA
ncbi:MAG: cysteine synthase A [Spirochaetales bacterium]|nr:cysteine synthase A [Spirochaetales bacterium]